MERHLKCVDCGKEFTARSGRQIRCEECRAAHNKERYRDYMREYLKERRKAEREMLLKAREGMGEPKKFKKKKPVKKEEDKSNICTKAISCEYGSLVGAEHVCDYLCKTGKRRPCKAGECTEYKRKGRQRSSQNEHIQL